MLVHAVFDHGGLQLLLVISESPMLIEAVNDMDSGFVGIFLIGKNPRDEQGMASDFMDLFYLHLSDSRSRRGNRDSKLLRRL